MIEGAVKDGPLNTAEWQMLQEPIAGLCVREILHVPRDHGIITELYRPDWDPTGLPVVHAYQSRLFPGAIGAWSCHADNFDRLFVNQGLVKLVAYDGREDSATYGRVSEYRIGDHRPTFVVLPPGVWHGLQNLAPVDALVINFSSSAYDYANPDHYRLPQDTDAIPYQWSSRSHSADAIERRRKLT
ncbi:MAG: dTDP-4-dehydrorhamnose 3,5-epimerase [Sphingomonas bacterium]|uniref:cupin domain-containing protein n=1 Tax=Sphingomonas bacterium TaxID=1895847 RepID=UPI002614631B|nr:dTDP-4-dehydrorhamnose 3,5-epimerase family protein [Sphingomonas bacterium]MDB5696986.1 dTDP-4-dehydrorhamnose 3,5-epimerase [Sphingomonas bacterium]